MRAPIFVASAYMVVMLAGCTQPVSSTQSVPATSSVSSASWSQPANSSTAVTSAYHLANVDVQFASGDVSTRQQAAMQKLADSIGSQTAHYFTGDEPVTMRVTLDDTRRKLGGQVALLNAAGTVLHQDRIYETGSRNGSLARAVDLGVGVGIGSGGKARWGIGLGLDLLNVLAALGSSGGESAELNQRFAERVGIWLQGLG